MTVGNVFWLEAGRYDYVSPPAKESERASRGGVQQARLLEVKSGGVLTFVSELFLCVT